MKIILIAVLIILFIGTIKCIPVNFSKKVFERKQKERMNGYLDFIHFTNSDVHLWRFALPGGNQKNVSWNRCTV